MDDRTMTALLKRLDKLKDTKLERRIGTVTDDSPLTVEIGDVELPNLPRLGSYTPTIGDRVYVEISGHDLLVLGEIV